MPEAFTPRGFFAPVLHAHLPFVRHPEYEDCLEEDWLFEAITETYIPLLRMMQGLESDGCDFRLTMVFTPSLCEMLKDELLRERYGRHLAALMNLAAMEVERTATSPQFHEVARMYQRRLSECRDTWAATGGDLLAEYRALQDRGKLEIITCAATHGYLPLLRETPRAVEAQIRIGRDHYEATFGRAPRGIWLPECGYYPGLDAHIKAAGIRYFFLDSHGVLFADKRPHFGVFAPLYCPSGVAAFGRDIESSRSVWSAQDGYPGDPRYREFYRDIGYDLDYEYIRPYIHESGIRTQTGLKYHRITGPRVDLHEKQPYIPREAAEAAAEHAGNFMFNRQQQVLHLSSLMERPPLIVSPYDAELFGHWWYEGPQFLNYLLRKIHFDQEDILTITPSEYLDRYPQNQVATPAESSWGNRGFSEVWLDSSNDWIYRHLHKAAERMTALARKHPKPKPLERRALNQAARELLLAQASDWAFIMKTNTMVDYAIKRTRDHLLRFTDLYDALEKGAINEEMLTLLEKKDSIFANIDYRVYG